MAAENEYVLLEQPNKLVLISEIPHPPAAGAQPAVTIRLVVEQTYRYSPYAGDVEEPVTMDDVSYQVPLRDLDRPGIVDLAFNVLVARLSHPMARPDVAPEARKAAARVAARCGGNGAEVDEGLAGVEFRLRVVFIDEDDESESDLEFGGQEEDLHDEWDAPSQTDAADDDGGGHFFARAYDGGPVREEGGPSDGALLLSGFETRSDGPELTEQNELTAIDMRRLVRKALNGGRSVEDDEGYQRALAAGAPVPRASLAVMLDQALQSAGQQRQQQQPPTKPKSPVFRMRTGF